MPRKRDIKIEQKRNTNAQERSAETRAAARMGGGEYHKAYLKIGTVLLGKFCDTFPYTTNTSIYLIDNLMMPETNHMPT